MTAQEITQKSLNEWFDYDGVNLSWKDKTRKTNICFNAAGYPMIRYAKNARLVHRLVYMMVHGNLPNEIDHTNGVITDYSISNLRPVTSSENKYNQKLSTKNTSGYKGVCWDIRFKRWVARVGKNGKTYSSVGFDSAEDANEFVCLLREMLHGKYANHGLTGA